MYLIFALTFLAINSALANDFEDKFVQYRIVDDILPRPPQSEAKVKFSDVQAELGNKVTVTQTLQQPQVSWNHNDTDYYTLAMIGDMVPIVCDDCQEALYNLAEDVQMVQHWLVVNVPGEDVESGEVLSAFFPSLPVPGTGYFRYIFVIYRQPDGYTKFHELGVPGVTTTERVLFSISDFAQRYCFEDPVAANFLLIQTEVPVVSEVVTGLVDTLIGK